MFKGFGSGQDRLAEGTRWYYRTIYGEVVTFRMVDVPLVGGGIRKMLEPIVKQPLPEGTACPKCGETDDLHRFGRTSAGKQRFRCRGCGGTFTEGGALPGMRVSADAVAAAVSMFYGGLSLHAVGDNLSQIFDIRPSKSTIYGWVMHYTRQAKRLAGDYTPRVGETWIADETVIKVGGKNTWFWDIIDSRTRFLLASHITPGRTKRNAGALMSRALSAAKKAPEAIVTDKLRAYLEGVEATFGADTKHIQAGPFTLEDSTRDIERFHGTLKDRTKVMRGLSSPESARLLTEGWLLHYNFIRGHEGLGGETPARAARVKVPFRNWAGVVKHE